MKVWVLVIDGQVQHVYKKAQGAYQQAITELYEHAKYYHYSKEDYKEALKELVDSFSTHESNGYFGTYLLDWEICVTETELSS